MSSATFSVYSALLPVIAILLFFNKIKEWHLWVIFLYCIYSFTNDNIILYRSPRHLTVSKFLYYFTIVEYLAFGTYLFTVLTNKLTKRILITVSIAFVIYCLYYIFTKPFRKFDSVQTSIEAIVLIAFCMIYFFEQMNKPQITFIYSSYNFWVIIGILIYLSGTFFLFIYASTLSAKEVNNWWIINYISNILKNVLFALAIVIYAKEKPANKVYQRKQLHALN